MARKGHGLGLHQRANRWYIRIRVPHAIRTASPDAYDGREFIVESCQTGDRAAAARYAMRRVAELRDEFAAIQAGTHATTALKLRPAQRLIQYLTELRHKGRAGGVSRDELDEVLELLREQATDLDENDPALPTVRRALNAVTDPTMTPLTEVVTVCCSSMSTEPS